MTSLFILLHYLSPAQLYPSRASAANLIAILDWLIVCNNLGAVLLCGNLSAPGDDFLEKLELVATQNGGVS